MSARPPVGARASALSRRAVGARASALSRRAAGARAWEAIARRASLVSWGLACLAACGGAGGRGASYPSRSAGCPVRRFPEQPTFPVDELGVVKVECTTAGGTCERQLLDAVCQRGGDVAWGMADNALSATTLVAHAAHSRRVTAGPHERGCEVRVADAAPPGGSSNVGSVTAWCSPGDSNDVCMRELEDQVCLLGGNYLWQVEGPVPDGDKQRLRGRAAATR